MERRESEPEGKRDVVCVVELADSFSMSRDAFRHNLHVFVRDLCLGNTQEFTREGRTCVGLYIVHLFLLQ